jgi:hypothetical protein
MVATLVKKKGGSIPELGNPVVFTRDHVKHRLFSTPPIFYYEILGARPAVQEGQ